MPPAGPALVTTLVQPMSVNNAAESRTTIVFIEPPFGLSVAVEMRSDLLPTSGRNCVAASFVPGQGVARRRSSSRLLPWFQRSIAFSFLPPSQPSRQRHNVLLESRHIRLISPPKTFLPFHVVRLEFVFGFCAVEFVQIEKRLFRGQSDLLVPVKPPGRDCKQQHKHHRDERQQRSGHADG